jgi:hypothetical protein
LTLQGLFEDIINYLKLKLIGYDIVRRQSYIGIIVISNLKLEIANCLKVVTDFASDSRIGLKLTKLREIVCLAT